MLYILTIPVTCKEQLKGKKDLEMAFFNRLILELILIEYF